MFTDVHHVAFVVDDLATAADEYEAAFDLTPVYEGGSDDWNVAYRLYRGGNAILEIVTPVGPGWFQDHLDADGPGFFHVAYEVDDIRSAMTTLETRGIRLEHDEPQASGANAAWEVVTLDERDTLIPTQIVQDDREDRFDFT